MAFSGCDPVPYQHINLETHSAVATVSLSRPQARNALDPLMIKEMSAAFAELEKDSSIRVCVLKGEGKVFCAGADIEHMKDSVKLSEDENVQSIKNLENMLKAVGNFSKPLVACIQGAAIGGGLGLVSCVDIVVSDPGTVFGLSEVRLGILPAVIMPYVYRKIGFANLSEYMLTGERFNTDKALSMNLVQREVAQKDWDEELKKIISSLMKGGIQAQIACKKTLREMIQKNNFDDISQLTIQAISEQRIGEEAQEGLQAFLEKRSASWVHDEKN